MIESDRVFRMPLLRMAEVQSGVGSPALGGLLGSWHALEIPFVFGTLETPDVEVFTGGGPDALALSAKMQDAWLAFVRSGDPSTPALGEWPRYDAVSRTTMVLGAETRVEKAPLEEERAYWDDRPVGRYRAGDRA